MDNWVAETEQGRNDADDLVIKMREERNPLLLATWLRQLTGRDELTGREAGFINSLAETLIAG